MGSHGQKASVNNRWVLSREWRSSHTRHQRGRMFHCCRHYEAVEVISPSLISIHVGSNVECECNFNVCQCKMKSRQCPHECVRARSHAWSINCIAPRAWVGAWELRVCFFKTQHLFIRGREGGMDGENEEREKDGGCLWWGVTSLAPSAIVYMCEKGEGRGLLAGNWVFTAIRLLTARCPDGVNGNYVFFAFDDDKGEIRFWIQHWYLTFN